MIETPLSAPTTLSGSAYRLWNWIADHPAHAEGVSKLADRFGCDERTMRRWLRELESAGKLRVVRHGQAPATIELIRNDAQEAQCPQTLSLRTDRAEMSGCAQADEIVRLEPSRPDENVRLAPTALRCSRERRSQLSGLNPIQANDDDEAPASARAREARSSSSLFRKITAAGCSWSDANRIIAAVERGEFSAEHVEQQIAWLPDRGPRLSPGKLLLDAIFQGYGPPANFRPATIASPTQLRSAEQLLERTAAAPTVDDVLTPEQRSENIRRLHAMTARLTA